jgi:hypothetical protein
LKTLGKVAIVFVSLPLPLISINSTRFQNKSLKIFQSTSGSRSTTLVE